ncbi:serine/threonine-protein kinase PknK [Vitiosangium sp. GDMCC 1.1324]|uniref:serine/threonine-protein kinase n=1 Tax=Vitiosangium sp. (strain GDMCC 1.1324) TaxID=2138576 RepID=UPI000D3B9CA9|nr:protein kinase [Vitiosangium sp. GDMCC 1.1324]PTL80481.1 serine/threonine-protein kinase PknK [Vitiosangium sp. GDMCC 1.1324]
MGNDSTVPTPPRLPVGIPPLGSVIAGRFVLEALAGRGGMGFIFRTTDSATGRTVALKLMHAITSPEAVYRFNREAFLLSELRHPGIVSYVHHGQAKGGLPFLAMEWLEGEDLLHRLARKRLGLAESLALLRRAAEALATAHQQGIVHRDLKPSNLFLRGGRPEDVVLLDFGLARHATGSLVAVTRTGSVVGTPGYMAPEQVSSQPEIPPAADIFSLGCVLYECLSGQPPFAAPHFAAALAKILYAEPVPLHTLCPGLPEGLRMLVDWMLVKDAKRRLPDATRLLGALSALDSVPELLGLPAEAARPSLLEGAEQRLVSVLLVSLLELETDETDSIPARRSVRRDALRTALSPYGAQVELLADGSLVATLAPERGTATDQVMLAARCALTFKERWPEASVVLVTGLGVFNERLPVGEAMDRAGRLLHQLERTPSSSVVVDDVTAGLLGPGFLVARSGSGSFELRGEQLDADASRLLMGRPTPCVGREQELALLDFTLDSCIAEPSARAILVTAPAGVGKSRLRHEFLRRLERREQPPLVLLGRGDPMGAGASCGLLGQALRRLCGIVEGENQEARRARLYQRVVQHLPEEQAQEAVAFLGELCAIPFPEEDHLRLRTARRDPRLMSAQVGRALVAFLGAECARQPVLLVLEDLHWSDALSVKLVDELLGELAEQPFMVLALARPEVKGLFPPSWSKHLQELPLYGLSHKAGARLVREVLGERVPEAVVQRTVDLSDGNALFLEELIRMAAEGRGDSAPETVLAVLQARLTRMEPGVRQVLLAASIFGRSFGSGGVGALLGAQVGQEVLARHLPRLVEEEVIEPQPGSRSPGGSEYRFRHALVRDAAYGLLSESHRMVGHRLAGGWLERMGETDAVVLATHHQLGGQPERAADYYIQAAEQLFERSDLQGTNRCVESALACGVGGEALTRLRALQAVVAFWMDEFSRALELGIPVLSGLKAGSRLWCWLMTGLILASIHEGHQEQGGGLIEWLLRTGPEPEAIAAYIEAVALLGLPVSWLGERQKMEALLGRLTEVGAGVIDHDAMARGWMGFTKSYFLDLFEARPWEAFRVAEQAAHDFLEIGAERSASLLQTYSGMTLAALGELPGALARMRTALAVAEHKEQHATVGYIQHYLMLVLASSSEPAHWQEAWALALEYMGSEDSSFRRGSGLAVLAKVLAAQGALSQAEECAREACELLRPFRSYQTLACETLSTILRAQGRATEAREVAELGVRELERMGGAGVSAVAMHLALAEACFAQGDGSAGDAALREALRCVRARASDIPEAEARECFLRQVPENARTLDLARQRWGDAVVHHG